MKKPVFKQKEMIEQIISYLDISSFNACENSAKIIAESIIKDSKITDSLEELSSQFTQFGGIDNEEEIGIESLLQINNPTEKSFMNLDENKKNIRKMTLERILTDSYSDIMSEIEIEAMKNLRSPLGRLPFENIDSIPIYPKNLALEPPIPSLFGKDTIVAYTTAKTGFTDEQEEEKYTVEELVIKLLRRGAYDNKIEAEKAVREVLAAMAEEDPSEPSNDNGTNNNVWNLHYFK